MTTQARRSQKLKTSKSSLVSHTFPPFYACYLLKSIKNPKSIATYIGSTPHPPRRIRQHNGEITQGAWKTSRNRPWVMNMIVHGFPSKLAALQFEWAWQHPDLSRHLKSGEMTKGRTLKGNIAVAHSMLKTHPYTSWPLRVKLFTPEAVEGWTKACKDALALPPGFTFSVELEGVDGKRDDQGSGRNGPIDVTDRQFTLEHIAKHIGVLATGINHSCTICGSDLDLHKGDPLTLALCPTRDCTAYAHLTCLAYSFLSGSSAAEPSLIPRGGACRQCRTYVLWGDVVRGCYRRRTGGQGTVVEQSAIVEEAEQDVGDDGQVFEAERERPEPISRKRKAPAASTHKKVPDKGKRKPIRVTPPEEEGEFFDLDAISGSESESESSISLPSGAGKKAKPFPRARGRPLASKSKRKRTSTIEHGVPRELFDIDDFSSPNEVAPTPPSKPALKRVPKKSTSEQTAGIGLEEALASMRIRDASGGPVGQSPSLQKRTRPRSRQRSPNGGDKMDVIEISD